MTDFSKHPWAEGRGLRLGGFLVALSLTPALATGAPQYPQEQRPLYEEPPQREPYGFERRELDQGRRTPRRVDHELELSLADSSFWLQYHTPFDRTVGQFSGRLFSNSDGDFAGNARLQRWGRGSGLIEVGVGLGAYLAFVDEPDDTVFSIAVNGGVRYPLPTTVPSRFVGQLALAPEITTSSRGEGIIDLDLRWEVEVNEYATVFMGYRYFEVNLENEAVEETLDNSIQVGVRLGF